MLDLKFEFLDKSLKTSIPLNPELSLEMISFLTRDLQEFFQIPTDLDIYLVSQRLGFFSLSDLSLKINFLRNQEVLKIQTCKQKVIPIKTSNKHIFSDSRKFKQDFLQKAAKLGLIGQLIVFDKQRFDQLQTFISQENELRVLLKKIDIQYQTKINYPHFSKNTLFLSFINL